MGQQQVDIDSVAYIDDMELEKVLGELLDGSSSKQVVKDTILGRMEFLRDGVEAKLKKEDWPDPDPDRIMRATTTIKRIDHGCGVGIQNGRAEVTLEVEADTDAFIGWMVSLIKWLNAKEETRIYTVTGRQAHGD